MSTETSREEHRVTRANARPKIGPARRTGGPGPMGGQGVAEKAVSFGPSLRRLLGMMRPERLVFAVVIVMGIASVVGNVVGPKILGKATDVIFTGVVGKNLPAGVTKEQVIEMLRQAGNSQLADMVSGMNVIPGQGIDFTALGHWLLLALALYAAAAVLGFIQQFLLIRGVQRTVYRMRNLVNEKMDRLPLAYFDRQPRGELLSRITNDMDNVQQTLQQTLGQLLNSILTVIGVAVMMFTVSPMLAWLTLAIIPVAGVASVLIGKQAQKQFTSMWARTGELNGEVEEAYTGHALVKVFGRQHEVAAVFDDTNEKLFASSFRAQLISAIIMPVNFFIGNLNYVAIAVVGGLQVANGRMPLGNVQAFIQYSRMFTQPMTQIASMANLLQSGVASAERVFEVLDADEQAPDTEGALPETVEGHVEFRDVDFSYSADRPLIQRLSLEARPGQTIAIVGPTGAGKTTLVNLLERFYEIQGGQILLDGVDITSVPRADLRGKLGMVLQDTWLFGGTIRDNIAYGRPGATTDEVIDAAKAAHVDRFVHQLPHGYDTVINDEGTNISAGEKQLITIARAFIADPEVLILDEATSSVDTRTEVLVQQAMTRLRSGRTSFVIAHRLSTIRDADLILVMEHGAIVEQGTHDELLETKGAYHDLYQSQFAAAIEDAA
ncbi:ABC transporter ATP-binding protein [Brooklawnia cerclae]|uniref:ATP-binding cassette subfamily B protein n=1 Tax=Brooklawnia cerclae TaxID=349934 RepID=A0ABX0SN90_9ACTN|nr:ABC transporter ATP-binding protein [Brooklawnia cerclae]NIH58778.1 ATP-binding cassette subfamily B protein [Brooklawnia cerclae]